MTGREGPDPDHPPEWDAEPVELEMIRENEYVSIDEDAPPPERPALVDDPWASQGPVPLPPF